MLKTSRFQLLISCEELLFAAEEEDCNVMHISKVATQCGIVYYESMVIKCKVSGTWINYDIEIEKCATASTSSVIRL